MEKHPSVFDSSRPQSARSGKFWLEFTQPDPSFDESHRGLRARLLSYLLISFSLLSILAAVLPWIFLGIRENAPWNLFTAVIFGVAYFINRTRYYLAALGLTLAATWFVIAFLTILLQEPQVLYFLILVILLSGLSFSPRLTILTTIVDIVTIVFLTVTYPWITPANSFSTSFLMFITSIITTIGAAVQRRDARRIQVQAHELREEGRILQAEMQKRIAAEERLIHDALHDPLTGLPNRRLFNNQLEYSGELSRRHPDLQFAVIYLDFDRFKTVNDSLGHSIGDELLVSLAARLKSAVRSVDTVARMGGDEFAILLAGVHGNESVIAILDRILDQFALPFDLAGSQVTMSASLGVVLDPAGYEKVDDILRDADFAMYHAKVSGKNRYKIFDAALRNQVDDEMRLESSLRRALSNQEFQVQYLPVYSLPERQIIRFEALLRWEHPERGRLYPQDFLRTAEESGLIIPIGDWLMRVACTQMKQWLDQTSPGKALSISVNLSLGQFNRPDLIEKIETILHETDLPGECLYIELSEMTLIENVEESVKKITRLQELGVGVEIDDFGTGYSSLGYLRRLPVNHLKIDRSFISTLGDGESAVPIIRAIIAMAASLGIGVIAEGIETQAQADNLVELNCKFGQGFFFNKAVDADYATRLLQTPS